MFSASIRRQKQSAPKKIPSVMETIDWLVASLAIDGFDGVGMLVDVDGMRRTRTPFKADLVLRTPWRLLRLEQ